MKVSILLFLIFGTQMLSAQDEEDLYSLEASKAFAEYLFVKGDLDFAADEYARILYLNPTDDTLLVRLSRIYRKLDRPERGQDLFEKMRSDQIFGNGILEEEYLSTLLFQKDQMSFESSLLKSKTVDQNLKSRMSIEQAMLQRRWTHADSLLRKAPPSQWRDVYQETSTRAMAFSPRRPWLAGCMSAIVPGSGKIYSKNTKEGITSFLFVAAMGYQSFRAFDKRGTKSVAGWIYGSLGLGFYLGNIYGSQQSAKNYNTRTRKTIHEDVDAIIYNRY